MKRFFPFLLAVSLLLSPEAATPLRAAQPVADAAAASTPSTTGQPGASASAAAEIPPSSPEGALAALTAAAEQGNVQAMLALGSYAEQGVNMPRSYVKAMFWYEKAAAAGRPEGYYNVGICHEIGMGSTGDMAKAIQNYETAASLGLPLAMYRLSSIYISGNGAPKDVPKGLAWLEKAAAAGMPVAANDLGIIYLSGLLGQKKDEKRALELFTLAANMGSLEGVKNIAAIYKDGLGVKVDPAAAYTWYLIAQRGGYGGEDLPRMLGLLEGTLALEDIARSRRQAAAWLEEYVARRNGGQ